MHHLRGEIGDFVQLRVWAEIAICYDHIAFINNPTRGFIKAASVIATAIK
jgi:hypothetical protein